MYFRVRSVESYSDSIYAISRVRREAVLSTFRVREGEDIKELQLPSRPDQINLFSDCPSKYS